MGTITDKANEEEDERLEKLRKENEAKKYHKRDDGLMFTQVIISKIVKDRWVGEFYVNYFNSKHNDIETSVHGRSPEHVKIKVGNFLKTELNDNEFTIKQ